MRLVDPKYLKIEKKVVSNTGSVEDYKYIICGIVFIFVMYYIISNIPKIKKSENIDLDFLPDNLKEYTFFKNITSNDDSNDSNNKMNYIPEAYNEDKLQIESAIFVDK